MHSVTPENDNFRIRNVAAVSERLALVQFLEPIFYAASARTSFENYKQQTQFFDRWLGRYLSFEDDCLLICEPIVKTLESTPQVAGYLVGTFQDPNLCDRFQDIGYFSGIKNLTHQYPAHLHINFAQPYRGLGLGTKLIEEFCRLAAAEDCRGVHVVTGEGSRNVTFYKRNGFVDHQTITWNGGQSAFLGRKLKKL